jgi:hypothetical protein
VDQILLRAKVPLSRLDTRVAEQELNLLQLAAGGAAQLCRGSPTIMRRDPRNPSSLGVRPQHLPEHLFGQHVASHLVAANYGPEDESVHHAGRAGPCIDCHLDPRRHRNRPHAPVLAVQIDDAPPAIALLHVVHRKRGDLGPP